MAELNIPAGVGEENASVGLSKAQDDLDQILKAAKSPEVQARAVDLPEEEAPLVATETPPPQEQLDEPPATMLESVFSAASYAVSPEGLSAGARNVAEVPRAVVRGGIKGFDAVIGIGDMLQDAVPVPGMQLFDMDGNFDPKFVTAEEIARDTKIKNEAG